MSLAISQNALSTSSEKIVSAFNGARRVKIKNLDASIVVYVGTTTAVASTNGWGLKTNDVLELDDVAGELWAIAASGTPSIAIIEQFQ